MASNNLSFGESLHTSEETREHTFLYGPVPANTHACLPRLAKYLGISTENALREWLDSAQFKPIYEALYNNAVLPRKLHNPSLQGPKLPAVQTAIDSGEMHGDERYSGYELDISDFSELDHYALCLYRLRNKAKVSRGGIFRDKQMSDSQIDERLWQAMLRGGLDRSKAKAKSLPAAMAELSINVQEVDDGLVDTDNNTSINIGSWYLVDGACPSPRPAC